MIYRIKGKIKGFLNSVKPTTAGRQSYSQAGEDAILKFLFDEKKQQQVSYLDIGTFAPVYCNNTYLFYTLGSTGVCIEADRSLIGEIKRVRPKDTVLNAGISVDGENDADFYIFDVKAINTFDHVEAKKRQAFGTHKIIDVVKVQLLDINTVIAENFSNYPVLLSIDVEGLDLPVLRTLNFDKFPIPVICVETCVYSENHIRQKDNLIAEFMLTKGYEIYADTYINTIFVNKSWFYEL